MKPKYDALLGELRESDKLEDNVEEKQGGEVPVWNETTQKYESKPLPTFTYFV